MRFDRSLLLGALCAAACTALFGCASSQPVAATSAAAPAQSDAGLHTDWIDKSADPSQDFFAYANGNWQKQNPIPAAYARWGTFSVLDKHNQEVINQILQDASKDAKAAPGSTEQKVGDFYAMGMDENAADAAGAKPLQPVFDSIAAVHDERSLQQEVARLQTIGVNAMFRFGQTQDLKDSTKVIGAAFQGGLGLPDRDYYLKDDPKFKQVRDAYLAHVAKMFQLLGDPADKAQAEAKTVMDIEMGLAQASTPRVDLRNPENIYHPMDLKGLAAATPAFSWTAYFADVGHAELQGINLATPAFFTALDGDLKKVSLAEWKTYLRWHAIATFAPYLSKPFVDEDFQMQAALTGAKELLPRWQRVVQEEDGDMGFAVGNLYVQKAFPPSSKAAVIQILEGIRGALNTDLTDLAWMSPETRKAASVKLGVMEERIGYPDKWRDYSALDIKRDSYVQNVMRANEFEQHRQLNKIGKPVDKDEWGMTPQMVNAYYSPQRNNINFPAGILQPPFFDPTAPPAVNYGALGFVMGHEMTHGFDDQGARFDGSGNFLSGSGWWTKDDYAKFTTATNCISDHMSSYTVDGGLHVQGHLVTGEATADLGGLTLAYRAFHASPAYKEAKTIDGYTPDQQFFLGAAHVWAMNIRPEESRRLVTIDPHPPGVDRVNGTLANMPQFQEAWHVPDGAPMVNKDRCVIW